jgi:hypothetical protein
MSTKDLLSALHPSLTDEQKAILAQFLEERETEVAKLKTQLEKVKQVAFKRSSEKIPPDVTAGRPCFERRRGRDRGGAIGCAGRRSRGS